MLGQNGQYSFTKSTHFTPEGAQTIDVPSGLTLNIYSLSDLSADAELKPALFSADRERLERWKTEAQWEDRRLTSSAAKREILKSLVAKRLVAEEGDQFFCSKENKEKITDLLEKALFEDNQIST